MRFSPRFEKTSNGLTGRSLELEEGGDREYQVWRERLLERRFRKPEVHQLLDVEFRVSDGSHGW